VNTRRKSTCETSTILKRTIMHPLVGAAFGLAYLILWGASVAWVVGDAQKRGNPGCALLLVLGITAPFSALIWLLVRPRTGFVDRPVQSYTNADDALAAASRLDMLGDWDEAIELYQYAATQWPEHGDYIRECVKIIEGKKAAARP
jgi:hypothetical protein